MLAGLGGDNRRVQGEQAGLVGNFIDNREDLADLVRLGTEIGNRQAGPVDHFADFADAVYGFIDSRLAVFGIAGRFLGEAVGFLGVLFNLLDRGVEFDNR